MAIEIERKEPTAAELRRLACRAASPAQARRMLAMALVLEGADRTTAARTCGMDRQTLRDWVHRYNAEGLAGLVEPAGASAAARLTPAQVAALVDSSRPGPIPRWTGWCAGGGDLQRGIAGGFGVELHERRSASIWRRATPGCAAPAPSEGRSAAQEAFKNVWPAPSARGFVKLARDQSAQTYPVSRARLAAKMELRASRSS